MRTIVDASGLWSCACKEANQLRPVELMAVASNKCRHAVASHHDIAEFVCEVVMHRHGLDVLSIAVRRCYGSIGRQALPWSAWQLRFTNPSWGR